MYINVFNVSCKGIIESINIEYRISIIDNKKRTWS